MAGTIEAAAREKGILIPEAALPAANYLPYARTGTTLFTSGQLPLRDGTLLMTGKLGSADQIADAQAAARQCALNILAVAKLALGDLDRVKRLVKIVGFVSSEPGFTSAHLVINGASDLLAEVFGEAGRHARSAVGVAVLPLDAAVEVEAIFEVSVD